MISNFKRKKKNYKEVRYEGDQRKLIEDLSIQLSKSIDRDKLALFTIRGYFLGAITEWQIKNSKEFAKVRLLQAEDRIKYIQEIVELVKKRLHNVFRKESEIAKLQQGILDTIQYYIEEYAYQDFFH